EMRLSTRQTVSIQYNAARVPSLPEEVKKTSAFRNRLNPGVTNGRSCRSSADKNTRIYSRSGFARFDDDRCRLHDWVRHFYCLRRNRATSRIARLVARRLDRNRSAD